nr:hypothetical protein [Ophiocordyceps lanpingensis]
MEWPEAQQAHNFSVIILDVMGNTGTFIKQDIICKEQEYINLYKPVLNLNPTAGSSMGFKHSEESKRLISEFRKGKPLSEKTKIRLSTLFSYSHRIKSFLCFALRASHQKSILQLILIKWVYLSLAL